MFCCGKDKHHCLIGYNLGQCVVYYSVYHVNCFISYGCKLPDMCCEVAKL